MMLITQGRHIVITLLISSRDIYKLYMGGYARWGKNTNLRFGERFKKGKEKRDKLIKYRSKIP